MERQITLPCGLCGGDGYSPFNILKVCPDCEGLGVEYSMINEIDDTDSKNQQCVPVDSSIQDESSDYDLIPF